MNTDTIITDMRAQQQRMLEHTRVQNLLLLNTANLFRAVEGKPLLVLYDCADCGAECYAEDQAGLVKCPRCGYASELPGRAADTVRPQEAGIAAEGEAY